MEGSSDSMQSDLTFRASAAAALIGFAALVTSAILVVSCSKRQSLDFRALGAADRIQIKDLTAQSDLEVGRIDDSVKVRYVLEFLERHKDGWTEPFGGSPIPQLMMEFYKDGNRLGGVGLDSERLIADPATHGWWSLPISSKERDDLLKQLGLTLPQSGKTQK
jgi:hypothetical protein